MPLSFRAPKSVAGHARTVSVCVCVVSCPAVGSCESRLRFQLHLAAEQCTAGSSRAACRRAWPWPRRLCARERRHPPQHPPSREKTHTIPGGGRKPYEICTIMSARTLASTCISTQRRDSMSTILPTGRRATSGPGTRGGRRTGRGTGRTSGRTDTKCAHEHTPRDPPGRVTSSVRLRGPRADEGCRAAYPGRALTPRSHRQMKGASPR